MRFGNWRGVTLALGLAVSFVSANDSRAGDFHLIKGEVDAINYDTGQPEYAPPIPYGHYAKDKLGHVGKAVGGLTGSIFGKLHGLGNKCGSCGGAGCGACGGSGFLGGHGHGGGVGSGGGCADGNCGGATTVVSGYGTEVGNGYAGGGFFGRKKSGCGVCGIGHSSTTVIASGQGVSTPQAPIVSAQGTIIGTPCNACGTSTCSGYGKPGCGFFGKRAARNGCGSCGGAGCGACGGGAGFGGGNACGSCGGAGCGACGGLGRLGSGCRACGGAGCGLCSKAKGLVSGLWGKLTHKGDIKWFVGPGGPVPLTPGYVPYVISTRSPRDFLSFAPFNPDAP